MSFERTKSFSSFLEFAGHGYARLSENQTGVKKISILKIEDYFIFCVINNRGLFDLFFDIFKNFMESEKNIDSSFLVKKKDIKLKRIWKKRKKIIIFFFVVILVASIYLYSKNKKEESANTYTLSAVSKGSVFSYVSGSGQVSSVSQIDINSKVEGYISSILVQTDQEVKKGDVLATIENNDLGRKLNESFNSLAIAKNNLQEQLDGASKEEILSAKISLNNAKTSYSTAVSNLENIKTSNEDDLEKAEQSLASAQRSYELALKNSESNAYSSDQEVVLTYNSAKSTLDSSYISLRSTIISADSILGLHYYNSNDISSYENVLGVRDSATLSTAKTNFFVAKEKFEAFEVEYKSLSTSWTYAEVEGLLDEVLSSAEASQKMMNSLYLTLVSSITSSSFSQSQLDSLKSSASSGESSALSTANSIRTTILNIEKLKVDSGTSDLSSLNSVENARVDLAEAQNNLEKVKKENVNNLELAQTEIDSKKSSYDLAQIQYDEKVAGPSDIDLLSYRIQVSQAESNYLEAKENYEALNVVSPIDGKVAKIYLKYGEEVKSSDTIITVISDDKLAEITLNEVDVAKVKVGQKATMTFSALSEVEITGEVVEVDSVGTTNQGVVSYSAKVKFDVTNDDIKPQMSVSVDIITAEKIDVLIVSSSLIKTDSTTGLNYVEVFNSNADNKTEIVTTASPDKKYIEVGLEGDSYTEILSGLEEGDLIITKTSSSNKNSSSSTSSSSNGQSSLFNMGGGGPEMGGMMR